MQFKQDRKKRALLSHRRGAAVVEAALILPVLILITFGAIDISQYINLSQLVANASREGASVASHNGTKTVQEVEDAVRTYLEDCFPQLSNGEFAQGFQVEVRSVDTGELIPLGQLSTIDSGEPISVRVGFDFSIIRWMNGPDYWNGNVKESMTFCRRE